MSELERFSTALYGFLRFLTISYVCFFPYECPTHSSFATHFPNTHAYRRPVPVYPAPGGELKLALQLIKMSLKYILSLYASYVKVANFGINYLNN